MSVSDFVLTAILAIYVLFSLRSTVRRVRENRRNGIRLNGLVQELERLSRQLSETERDC